MKKRKKKSENPLGVRIHTEARLALIQLKEGTDSPVQGHNQNFIINWAVVQAGLLLKMQKELENYLPAAKVREIKVRLQKYLVAE